MIGIAAVSLLSRRIHRAALLAAALVTLAGCASVSGAPEASISHVLAPSTSLETAVEQTQARVYETGIYYPFRVEVIGHKGEKVRVAAWTDQDTLLGETTVEPPFDTTVWEKLNIFMPISSYRLGGESITGTVYVLAPTDSHRFLASVGMSISGNASQRLVWVFRDFSEDVLLENGERGIRINVELHRFGYTDTSHRVLLVVRDEHREDFPSSLGGPIRIESKRLSGPADTDDIKWTLGLELPYSELKQLGEGRVITVTPSLRMSNGDWYLGNLHIEFLVGGSPDTMAAKMRDEVQRADSRINTLQRELDVLQGR